MLFPLVSGQKYALVVDSFGLGLTESPHCCVCAVAAGVNWHNSVGALSAISTCIFTQTSHFAELSVTTFCTFLRELSPPWSHGHQPPRRPEDVGGSRGVSACRFEVSDTVFPSRHRRRAQVGCRQSNSSSPPVSVQVGSRQFAAITGLLPIRFRPGLACLLPGRLEFLRYAVSGIVIHLIRRLPAERRAWKGRRRASLPLNEDGNIGRDCYS